MELNEKQKQSVEEIISKVCDYFGVDKTEVKSRGGEYLTYSSARHFCWYILHYDFGVSIRLISNMFHRSERQVKKAISKIKYGIMYQSYYRDRYNDITSKIKIVDFSL